ncbi:hypothetical protein [Persephonella sp.]
MKKTAGLLTVILLISFNLKAETLEERLKKLEEKIIQLEKRIQILEGKKNLEQPKEKKVLKQPVSFKVLSKEFHQINMKERLWEKGDKIILRMEFKNLLDKPVRNIKGKVYIHDKSGKKLMETTIKINKALNFITGMNINPEEVVRIKVSFLYNENNPNHRYVKRADLKDLVITFKPIEVLFEDETTIHY